MNRHETIQLVAYAMWENMRHHCHHLGELDYWLMAEITVDWYEPFAREVDYVIKHQGGWNT